MALLNFKHGLLANMPSAISDGTVYIVEDERAAYVDIGESRIRIGDFQIFANVTALNANTNPSTTALYFIEDVNVLARYNATTSKYEQINTDTGATSVDFSGTGNVITGATYDAATRKITFAKDASVATDSDLQTLKGRVDTLTAGLDTDGSIASIVGAVDDKVETLIGTDTGKSARTIANEELAAQLIPDNAKEALDTIKEIADWIQAHPDDASAMNTSITAIQNLVGTIPTHEVADENGVEPGATGYITTTEPDYTTIVAMIQSLVSTENTRATGAESALGTRIDDLDATPSQDASATNGQLAISLTQVDGKVTEIKGSISANTYDAYGAASDVQTAVVGQSTDGKNANTVYGAKKYADDALTTALTWGTF